MRHPLVVPSLLLDPGASYLFGRPESIAALLGRFGNRVQLSVFEVQLDENELDLVLAAIGRILETPENGSVRLYRWCLACRGTSVGVGDVEEADDGAA